MKRLFQEIIIEELNSSSKSLCSYLILVQQEQYTKARSRRCNIAHWDKGQCPHGALFHAVPGCCMCFQQCRVARKCPNSRSPSNPILLEALEILWDCVEQCSMLTLPQGAKLHSLHRPTLSIVKTELNYFSINV